MKKIILIILILASVKVHSTECSWRNFSHEYLYLSVCTNHARYTETNTLLIKAKAIQLNKFIGDLISDGKLKNKKVHIVIWDGLLQYQHINVSQNKNGYYISSCAFAAFNDLAKIIYYFTQPDWESYVYTPTLEMENQEMYIEKFEDLINQYSPPDLTKYTTENLLLWELDSIKLIYRNDEIHFYYGDTKLKYEPNFNLPVKIRDRYLFFQVDSFFVYQNSKEVLQFSTNVYKYTLGEDFSEINVYSKWVNIGFTAEDHRYSYSYEKNEFYELVLC